MTGNCPLGDGSARLGGNYGNTVHATVFGQEQEMYGALSDFLIMIFVMVCEAVTQSIFLSESTIESLCPMRRVEFPVR